MLPPSHLHLPFPIHHHPATMGVLIRLEFAAIARDPSPEERRSPELSDQHFTAEWNLGPRAGKTVAVFSYVFLEGDKIAPRTSKMGAG